MRECARNISAKIDSSTASTNNCFRFRAKILSVCHCWAVSYAVGDWADLPLRRRGRVFSWGKKTQQGAWTGVGTRTAPRARTWAMDDEATHVWMQCRSYEPLLFFGFFRFLDAPFPLAHFFSQLWLPEYDVDLMVHGRFIFILRRSLWWRLKLKFILRLKSIRMNRNFDRDFYIIWWWLQLKLN